MHTGVETAQHQAAQVRLIKVAHCFKCFKCFKCFRCFRGDEIFHRWFLVEKEWENGPEREGKLGAGVGRKACLLVSESSHSFTDTTPMLPLDVILTTKPYNWRRQDNSSARNYFHERYYL
jgi:hypothetical protein